MTSINAFLGARPRVRFALMVLSGICLASPTIPGLASASAVLVPVGTFIGGWLGVDRPQAAP